MSAAVLAAWLITAAAATAYGQTTAFTYQGELDVSDAPADGAFDMRFALFSTLAGGAQIGGNQTVSNVPVSDGIFTVQLDFGSTAFPGADRFLEIGVRPAGAGDFTTLAPRQQISSTPYAIRTLRAASADALSSACVGCVTDAQIGTVSGSKVSGAIPAASVPSGSGNYIQNSSTAQPNASFNVAGDGTVGGVVSASAVAVAGAALSSGVSLAVNNAARVNAGGSGGYMQLGTPGSESGLSIVDDTSRADLRFDGATLKLVAGPGIGPPGPTEGVVVHATGRVGIGTTTDTAGRLNVASAGIPGIRVISDNRAVWGSSTAGSRGVFGDSVSGEGVHGESVSGTGIAGVSHGPDGVGTYGLNDTGGTGVLGHSSGGFNTGFAMLSDGHAKQTRDKGGWLKAMAYVAGDGSILRCYNSQNPVFRTTGDCGFDVTRQGNLYIVNFGFNVADRFVSLTPVQQDILVQPAGYLFPVDDANAWGVEFRDLSAVDFGGTALVRSADFMILVF